MKHSLRLGAAGLLWICGAALGWGQSSTAEAPPPRFNHYFGLSGGFVSGTGISYRYWPENWGLQVTTAPLVSNQQTFLSLGVNGLFLVSDLKWSRFFTYLGLSGFYNQNSWMTSYGTNLGGGFGMELVVFDNFGLDLMGGFRGFTGQESSGWVFGTGPTIEAGIFYRL